MQAQGDLVLEGSWLYGGSVPSRVVVRASDIAFGSGDQDDPPDVSHDRNEWCLYVGWFDPTDSSRMSSEIGPFKTLRDVIAHVEKSTDGSIRWSNTPDPGEKIGVALASLKRLPLNGLRHLPAGGTCGWYIWGGEELSQQPDFFKPVHVAHLADLCPEVLPYLSLLPGSRFLLANGHEDIWRDTTIKQA